MEFRLQMALDSTLSPNHYFCVIPLNVGKKERPTINGITFVESSNLSPSKERRRAVVEGGGC